MKPSKITCFNKRNPARKKHTRVVNARTNAFDVYIGRSILGARNPCMTSNSPYVCPFQAPGEALTPDQLKRFRTALLRQLAASLPTWRNRLRKIQGLRLGCWCKPGICHGDVLADFADKLPSEEELRLLARRAQGSKQSLGLFIRAKLGYPILGPKETTSAKPVKTLAALPGRASSSVDRPPRSNDNLYGSQ